MTSKEVLDARMKVAQEFSKLFTNPLFNKEFLLLTENGATQEYNTIIVAAAEEKIAPTVQRFLKTGETQASIVSIVDGEVLLRVVSPVAEDDSSEIFDIFTDTTVYSWLNDENLHPEGIHVIDGSKVHVGGNIYRKNIEKLCGFADK
jgi:hypothetical protein